MSFNLYLYAVVHLIGLLAVLVLVPVSFFSSQRSWLPLLAAVVPLLARFIWYYELLEYN